MLYCPVSFVVTERTFSISAELDASTVTPGRTPPDASRTVPAIVAESWANAAAGAMSTARTANVLTSLYMPPPAPPARIIISIDEIEFSKRRGLYAVGVRLSRL
jgi:hypothetical protein